MSYDQEKRAKVESTGVEGVKGSKSNDCEATLRKGYMPKSSAVTTAKADPGACIRAAEKQNNGNVLALKLSQEDATAEARKKVNSGTGALNSDQADHK